MDLGKIKVRNNNDEIPKNTYIAFKLHDKVFREVLLSNIGDDGWWRREDLVRDDR